jgi:hypothetical protein
MAVAASGVVSSGRQSGQPRRVSHQRLYWPRMIRISISAAAFEAIAATMPLGSVGYEHEPDAKGERQIWLEPRFVDRLCALRGPGESYSDVILSVAKG